MERFRILPGLPPYGPLPEQFSASAGGTHHEGFVVEFFPENKPSWVGNFQSGGTGYCAVLPLPNSQVLMAIAHGRAYVIDADERRMVRNFGGGIEAVIPVPETDLLILSCMIHLEAWNAQGMKWRTRRLSWDGIFDLKVGKDYIEGMAWSPFGGLRVPFSVDLETGEVEGASNE